MRTGELGYWWRSLDGPPQPRPPLPGPTEAEVAIVGAGYTGLWTAYYLKRARPSLEIVILERELAGFGASGRNGGWVSGFFSGAPRVYERSSSRSRPPYGNSDYAVLQRTMFDTVDQIAAVLAEHEIDAEFTKGGLVRVALGDAQMLNLRGEIARALASMA
jgi:glycine/D-amino acid oxidase-like deaminating enzyme